MKRHVCRAAAASVAVLLCGSATLLAQNNPPAKVAVADSGWNVVVYPLLGWAPIYGVDVTLPPVQNPCVGCAPGAPSGEASSGLNGGWFGAFRVEKGWFAFAGDFTWAGLSATRTSPSARVDVDAFTGGFSGGVRIVKGLYAEAGARRQALDIGATILENPAVDWKPSRWEPVIGTTFRPRLGRHWQLHSHLDVGVGGSKLSTVNGSARMEWQPVNHFVLAIGYGFSTLRIDGEILSKPIHLSQTLHGPILGMGIPF